MDRLEPRLEPSEGVVALIEAVYPVLASIARGRFGLPPQDAEQVIHDALLALLAVDERIASPRAWVIAAVCNACRHYWRSRARFEAVEGTELDENIGSADEVRRIESMILARQVLHALRFQDREVLRLHYLLGLTESEIAVRRGTSRVYARKLITRALRSARSVMHHLKTER